MQIVDCALQDWRAALSTRIQSTDPELERVVARIIADVRQRGDEALLEIGQKFDSPHLTSIKVTEVEFWRASVPENQETAIRAAYDRILAFHQKQVAVWTAGMTAAEEGWSWQMPDSKIGQRVRPLNSAGLYVPGGRASYPSSVLMLSGPASAAGVKRIAVTSPCMADGSLPNSVLVAMRTAGIQDAYKIGGASAVAALAFGTETVEKVDKIAGPGNKFVNEAKRQLWGSVGVDGNYGPSEVCVVIDETADPRFAAADLLAQLEHAPDNLGFVVSLNEDAWTAMELEINIQLGRAPRAEILKESVANALVFVVRDRSLAADIVNEIAPEHLSLSVKEPGELFEKIRNAGCVLLGDWTPESAADYCLGPSHTLPTGAAARFANPVNALDFLKIQSFGELEPAELRELAGIVEALAEAEGFPAHGFATKVRKSLGGKVH